MALTAAACTGSGYEPQAESEGTARVTGMLFVERSQGGSTSGVQVGARFLRIVGVDDAALPDLVGTPVIPRAGACVEHGTPSSTLSNTASADASRAEVRLLDVGPIDVTAEGRALQMQPRRFPDLWNVVSGVLYGAESEMSLGTWHFSSQGVYGADVGRFDVTAQSPEDLADVQVAGVPMQRAAAQTLAFRRHTAVPVRWAPSSADDRVAIVFEGNGSVVCGARDTGAFDVDAATMDRVGEILRNGGTVSVHRMRSHAFQAQGLDAATLVFDLSVRARARVE